MNYNIVYSNRKTIALVVKPGAILEIRAPMRADRQQIEKILLNRKEWVEKNLQKMDKKKVPLKQYKPGEDFLFLGKKYPLMLVSDYRSRVYFENAFFISVHFAHKAKAMMQTWYKEKAFEIINERIVKFSKIMGVQYKSIGIRYNKTRWGSCSSSGNLNFSWRLIMAPLEIIDYVVVHELAHIAQHNHSRLFWKEVATYFPEYKKAKVWLNEQGYLLTV